MRTLVKVVAIELVFFLVAGAVFLHAQENTFPPLLAEWGPGEWEEMSERDRMFFVYGQLLGTYVIYSAFAYEWDTRGGSIPQEAIFRELTRFQDVANGDADRILEAMEDYYSRGGGAPLFAAPTLIVTAQEEGD